MKKIYERVLENGGMVKHDIFSDARDWGFNALGIDKGTRDYVQPAVDRAASLLPKGGAVPAADAGNYSQPQATGFKFQSNIDPKIIIIAAVVLVAVVYVARK